ncbi:MAG TPA: PH domain-containing protein [Verrucomicrobiae bacterium]|nr:PH domain-containing protein [Verrucomicrobiae bacterium]
MPDKPTIPVKFYRPHRDWWVYLFSFLFVAIFLGGVPLVLWQADIAVWQRACMAGVALLLVISTIDKVYFTVYELGEEALVIHSQLRRAAIPYRDMQEISPTGFKALFSTKRRKRFAFSRHNMTIKVTNAYWDEISVSPYNVSSFLDHLLSKIDHERSRRATVSRKK